MPAKRPNILILMGDQIRADALGCYGNTCCITPTFDRLAREGVLFRNSFTPNPICVPARAILMTGNYAHTCTGNHGAGGGILPGEIKMAEHFIAHGYETYACGKMHFEPYSPPGKPRNTNGFQRCDLVESGRLIQQFDPKGEMRGLEDYHDYLADVGWAGYSRAHGIGNNDVRPCPTPLPAEHHVDHWVADRAIARLGEHMKAHPDKPFLLFSSFPKPHSPYDPPYDYVKRYDPRTIPPPVGDASMVLDRNPHLQFEQYTRAMTTLSPAARQVIKMYYYALITHQDAQIARVLAALEKAGVADDTIVLYCADHGDLMGDFGTYFKGVFLEGSARVPFLMRGPGIPKGETRMQLTGIQDVLPTLASMTGCPLPKPVQGLDLTPALAAAKAPLREVFYGQCFNDPRQSAMLTDGRWKYCYAQMGAVEELYDLASDPTELVNLASKGGHESRVIEWRERMVAEMHRLWDNSFFKDGGLATSPLDREALKKLPIREMGWRWF